MLFGHCQRIGFEVAVVLAGCAATGCALDAQPSMTVSVAPVYGTDDRQEYFEVAMPEARARMAASVVGLIPKDLLTGTGNRLAAEVPTLGKVDRLCPEESFFDQPAAAFCSGVLVDWDMVLTAGHCVRLLAVKDFSVVFHYQYSAPGQLAVAADDIIDIVDIVDEALDSEGTEPRRDYAWLRLARPVFPPLQPAPLYSHRSPLTLDQPIISIGNTAGVPMKFDAGGRVRDLRENWSDYFIADADVMHGSSGGGAFDQQLSLVGVMARGGVDTIQRESGCRAIRTEPDGRAAQEQFTYAHRAVEGLCRTASTASSICRKDCGDPCQALPLPSFVAGGGCAIAIGRPTTLSQTGCMLLAAAILASSWRMRRSKP